jgi:hypothetical protein
VILELVYDDAVTAEVTVGGMQGSGKWRSWPISMYFLPSRLERLGRNM